MLILKSLSLEGPLKDIFQVLVLVLVLVVYSPYRPTSSLSPCLNIDVIFAFYKSEGILPVSVDELIRPISEIMPAVWSIVRFPINGSIPSGPEEREYLVSRARSMISLGLGLVGIIANELWTDVVM